MNLIRRDSSGKSYLEIDKIFARYKAVFAALEIRKLTYAGGNYIFSPAGATCTMVEDKEGFYVVILLPMTEKKLWKICSAPMILCNAGNRI